MLAVEYNDNQTEEEIDDDDDDDDDMDESSSPEATMSGAFISDTYAILDDYVESKNRIQVDYLTTSEDTTDQKGEEVLHTKLQISTRDFYRVIDFSDQVNYSCDISAGTITMSAEVLQDLQLHTARYGTFVVVVPKCEKRVVRVCV